MGEGAKGQRAKCKVKQTAVANQSINQSNYCNINIVIAIAINQSVSNRIESNCCIVLDLKCSKLLYHFFLRLLVNKTAISKSNFKIFFCIKMLLFILHFNFDTYKNRFF